MPFKHKTFGNAYIYVEIFGSLLFQIYFGNLLLSSFAQTVTTICLGLQIGTYFQIAL